MKSVFSKAKNVISCLESFMSVTVKMTFPLWLNFSESIELRWDFRSILTFWQWIIKVRSRNPLKISECSSMKWTACSLGTNVRGPVESFSLNSPDQPVVSASLSQQSRATGTSGVFLTRTQMEKKPNWELMCVCEVLSLENLTSECQ